MIAPAPAKQPWKIWVNESYESINTWTLKKIGKINPNKVKTKARLGRVAPLGRPRSVYKSEVECRFVSRNDEMTLKVKVNASHFQYQLRESQDAYLLQIWWF